MAFFGPLVGYGASGLVFAHAGDEEQVIKLVYLPDRDPVHYEEFANQQQAKLFEELADLEETPVGLPQVYHYMEGTVGPWLEEEVTDQIADPEAQRIFDEEFTSGRKFGLWMMENVPHREDNQYGSSESPNERIPEVWSLAPDPDVRMGWRTRDYQSYVPEEQKHYREMSNWLLNMGYLVRDVKQLRNLGYRHAGTPVWYDPNVVTWPLETKEDQEAFDVIFTGFSPESIQNEIASGQYVENRRNAEDLDDPARIKGYTIPYPKTMMSATDTEYLNIKIFECINYFLISSKPMQNYQIDLCNITGGDHDYGPATEWEQDLDDDLGEHYQITCQQCGLMASAGINMSANGLDKILTFYDWSSNGEKVWQDPYKDIWYSHTKPPIVDAAGDIETIPY